MKFKKLLLWPSQNVTLSGMPKCFKSNFPNCHVIIDMSEIKCEKVTSIKSQIQLYSNYKSTFTVKFLFCIAPNKVTFLSKCYSGRTTDAQIITESGLVKLFESGDVVLADKGFQKIVSDAESQEAFVVISEGGNTIYKSRK